MTDKKEKVFADGFIAKRNDTAPEYVIVNLSVKVGEAMDFLNRNQSNGWVNLQVKRSQGGKYYVELDTWKPTQGDHAKEGMAQARAAAAPTPQGGMADFEDEIPFGPYEKGQFA